MAVNLSAIRSNTALGKLARLPLRLLPNQMVVPIFQGRARGLKWIVGAATHGCWLGSYESAYQTAFADALHEAQVVFDIGAHVGFYTLIAAAAVGSHGRVFAFEPSPRNLVYLRRHIELNGLGMVTVVPKAVADISGAMTFDPGESSSMGHLSSTGVTSVLVTTVDELTDQGEADDPDVIKIDVEGAEHRVLMGAAATIARARPIMFIATHGDAVRQDCVAWLQARNYRIDAPAADELIGWPADSSA